MDRVMIFIDGSNLFHSLGDIESQTRIKLRIDYERFKKVLTDVKQDRRLIRPYFYGSSPGQEPPKQAAFHTRLRYMGYEVKIFPLKEIAGVRTKEKMVDISLATDMLLFGHKNIYDVAILVSGDKDFTPAVKAVKEMGKFIEVAGFRHSTSPELIQQVGTENDGHTYFGWPRARFR